MGNYHNLYLKKDVLLLADVFEKFIDTCLKFYRLDPCHYFSFPGISWDAMVKMTGVKLENKSDINKYVFIEKGLKGEIYYTGTRFAKGNNKYMYDYDPKIPSTFITDPDMNSLYGWAISEYLPYDRFKWLKNVVSISVKSPIGYVLVVDLEYPNKSHKLHNDYPLAPEKIALSSDICQIIVKKC